MPIVAYSSSESTYISEFYPNSNFVSNPVLYVGQFTGANDKYRSLIKFDLSSLSADSNIISAVLKLFIYRNDTPYNSKPVKIFKALSQFATSTVTYNSAPLIPDTPEAVISITNEQNVYLQWDITNLVKDWCLGTTPNNGLVIIGLETENSLVGFRNKKYKSSENWPLLEVNYVKGMITQYPAEYVTTTDVFTGSTPLYLGPQIATFAVKNIGSANNAYVLPQLSPDGILWIDNIPAYLTTPVFAPGDHLIFNTDGYMPYARLGYKSQVSGNPANLVIYPVVTGQ